MSTGIVLLSHEFDLRKGTGIARYSDELFSALRQRGVDAKVMFAHTPGLPYGMALSHSLFFPLKVLGNVRDSDLVHAIEPITALSFPFLSCRRVVTFHDLTSILCKNTESRLYMRLSLPILFRIVTKNCEKAIAVSSQTKSEIVSYLGVPSEKVEVINPGVGDEFFQFEKKRHDGHVIGYVGALAKRKRVDSAIRAFKYLKTAHPELNSRLCIYGERSLEYENLVALVKELKLENDVEFFGFAPTDKLAEIYNSMDVFVFPSEWEGFGLPILEAQKCGVPVIVRESARIPSEVMKCCVRARSEMDMADKIHDLLTGMTPKDDIIRDGLDYSKRFTWEKMVDATLDVYSQVLRR